MAQTYRLRCAVFEDRDRIYTIKSDALKAYAVAMWGPWDELLQRERFDNNFDCSRF